jgi:predicted transcriptional regulator
MTAITLELRDDIAGRIKNMPNGIERVTSLVESEFGETDAERDSREIREAIQESFEEEGEDLTSEEVTEHVLATIRNRKKVKVA